MAGATLLVSRHPGAREWLQKEAARRGWRRVRLLSHLEPGLSPLAEVERVAGVLPIGLAAELSARGIETWHLELPLDLASRGMELSASEMRERHARLRRYAISIWEE